MNDLIREAIVWAEAGIPVFPCKADKSPLTQNGFKDAVSDPEQVRALFEFYGAAAVTIGGRMGNGLFAVDVDLYKGEDVKAWLEARLESGDLPDTRVHETKRGGLHFIYEGDVGCCDPIHGVEIKGDGGYIILPGSPGYSVKSEGIAEAPASLLEIVRSAVNRSRGSTMTQLESAVLSGADFHNSMTQLAAKMAARGSDQVEIQARLLHLLKSSMASEPGHDRHARWRSVMADKGGEISRISSSAYIKFNDDAVMQEAQELSDGGMAAMMEVSDKVFTQLGEPDIEPNTTPIVDLDEDEFPYATQGYMADEDYDVTDQNFALFPIFADNETVIVSADPKAGKTVFCLTAAFHIACGLDYGTMKVAESGMCLYFGLEGTRALRLRVQAIRKTYKERGIKVPDHIPLFIVERAEHFMREQDIAVAKILLANKQQVAKTGTAIKVVFIDTLTKAMSGSDQNSVEDTSALFDIVGKLRAGGLTATIVFVHHQSKTGAVRGSSNIPAEADVILQVSKKNSVVQVKVGQARSIEDGGSYHYDMVTADLGTTKQGHAQTGVFLDPIAGNERVDNIEDFAEVQRIAQRRAIVTQLGDKVTAEAVLKAWFDAGLVRGRETRGKQHPPPIGAAHVQAALHGVDDSAGGGVVYGDYLIRKVTMGKDVQSFTVLRVAAE